MYIIQEENIKDIFVKGIKTEIGQEMFIVNFFLYEVAYINDTCSVV